MERQRYRNRYAAVEAAMKENATHSNRALAAAFNVGSKTIAEIRKRLEDSGDIAPHATVVGINGVFQPLHKGEFVPMTRRGPEIAQKAKDGMSVEQMGAYFGTSAETISDICKREKIPLPARKAQGSALKIDPQRVVSESVYTLAAMARSLGRIKQSEFTIADAEILCKEAVHAMPSIHWLLALLKAQTKKEKETHHA